VLGQRYYPIPYQVRSGISYIAITYLLVIFVNRLSFTTQLMATAFHLLVIGLFVVGVYAIERKGLKA
jgi:hypothetical protein